MTGKEKSSPKREKATLTESESDFLDFLDSVDKDDLSKKAEAQIDARVRQEKKKGNRDIGIG